MNIPILKTERLQLVPPSGEHAPAYREFYGDALASKFYGGPLEADDAWLKLARDVGHWHLRGYGLWILETLSDREVIGGCGLFLHEGWRRPELTWWILPDARRKGYAREASLAVIDYGYQSLKWDKVQTYMVDENTAARALAGSLGGRKIGRETFPDGLDRDIYGFQKNL